jgi:hypothetical protein
VEEDFKEEARTMHAALLRSFESPWSQFLMLAIPFESHIIVAIIILMMGKLLNGLLM